MTITAKYASICPCGRPITIGSQVEWTRGSKARHVSCAEAAALATRPRSSASGRRGTWTGCQCGSVEEYERPGDCRSCRHDR